MRSGGRALCRSGGGGFGAVRERPDGPQHTGLPRHHAHAGPVLGGDHGWAGGVREPPGREVAAVIW